MLLYLVVGIVTHPGRARARARIAANASRTDFWSPSLRLSPRERGERVEGEKFCRTPVANVRKVFIFNLRGLWCTLNEIAATALLL